MVQLPTCIGNFSNLVTVKAVPWLGISMIARVKEGFILTNCGRLELWRTTWRVSIGGRIVIFYKATGRTSMISIGWNNVSSMWWKIVSSSLTSSKFMKAYPTLRWKPWEQPTFTMRVRDTNLQLFAKSGFDIVSSPLFAYDLNYVFLTNSQIHEIVFAVTGFINDGFQHALKKKVRNAPTVLFCTYLSFLSELFLPDLFCSECCATWSGVYDLCQVAASWELLAYHTYCCADIQTKTNPLDVNGILISRVRVRIITEVMAWWG